MYGCVYGYVWWVGRLEGEIGYEVELFEWNVVIVVGVVVDCGW